MRTVTRVTKKNNVTILRELNWLKQLESHEQAQFVSGLLGRVLTALRNENWSEVGEWVEEWKATANVYADPQVARDVQKGQAELARGDSIDWNTLRQELGL